MVTKEPAVWAESNFLDVQATIYLWNGFANLPLASLETLSEKLAAILAEHRAAFPKTEEPGAKSKKSSSTSASKKSKDDVVDAGPADKEAILLLLLGATAYELGRYPLAREHFTATEALLEEVTTETWTIAYARFFSFKWWFLW